MGRQYFWTTLYSDADVMSLNKGKGREFRQIDSHIYLYEILYTGLYRYIRVLMLEPSADSLLTCKMNSALSLIPLLQWRMDIYFYMAVCINWNRFLWNRF